MRGQSLSEPNNEHIMRMSVRGQSLSEPNNEHIMRMSVRGHEHADICTNLRDDHKI